MHIWGKLIGAACGGLLYGVTGALIGGAVGHAFDSSLRTAPKRHGMVQTAFFTALFEVLGHLAKADGRISPEEIGHAEQVMRRMEVDDTMRQEAIRLFNRGRSDNFNLEAAIGRLIDGCGNNRKLHTAFIGMLFDGAWADNNFSARERATLQRIASLLGFSASEFQLFEAQSEAFHRGGFHSRGSQYRSSSDEAATDASMPLGTALLILGLRGDEDEKTARLAYRRLRGRHHPDKLVAAGMPTEMVRAATEKSQSIQKAYEVLCKERGFKQ